MIAMLGFLMGAITAQPSFDCERAETETEHAICADAELSRLDRQVDTMYRAVRSMLSPEGRQGLLNDQHWYLGARDQWFDNRDRWDGFPNLADRMRERVSFLASVDTDAGGWIGEWRNVAGGLTVTEQDGRLTLAFNTAHPANARWICDVALTGQAVDGVVEGPADIDENYRLTARLMGDVIRVEERPVEGRRGPPQYCGANGFVTGAYLRIRDGSSEPYLASEFQVGEP